MSKLDALVSIAVFLATLACVFVTVIKRILELEIGEVT